MLVLSGTDIGKVRGSNQDAFYADYLYDKSVLAIVCDGMGGANAGNIASSLAVKTVSDYIVNSYSGKMSGNSLLELMKNAVVSANIKVCEEAKKNPEYFGMGTTAVVVIVRDESAYICHAGDSRAYIINDEIKQITKDHSVVQSLLEDGKLTPEEAKTHPKRNVITKALGVEQNLIPDLTEISVSSGDMLLLCSDGLSNYVDESKMFRIIKENAQEETVRHLIDAANDNGGGDNITAVTVIL